MKTIRGRLITIGLVVVLCLIALVPRNVRQQVFDRETGRMKDTVVRRVPINLGLDLEGGVHLALEVDESRGPVPDCADAIQRAERVVRTRIDEFGTTEPVVQIAGRCRLIVELPGERDPSRAKQIIQRIAALEFRITDTDGKVRDALPAMDAALARAGIRAAGAGAPSAVAQLFGGDSAGAAGADTLGGALSAILFQGALPGEYLVPEEQAERAESLLARPEVQRNLPRGFDLRWGSHVEARAGRTYRTLYAVQDRAIITGEELEKAAAQRDPLTNQATVTFNLSRRGARRFGEATSQNVGNYLAIILDGRVQGQPPVIREPITGGSGQIELGGKPLEEASDLALVLRAGALPAPLQIVEEQSIGPSLGQDAIRDGIEASAVAVALVLLVMLVYYRLSGALAVAALALYAVFVGGGLAFFGFTLTLPGLAGFALSIGMAVDANVLIFERIREELQHGKTVRLAVDEGFKHAMSAIIDSNVTTVLTALILWVVGTEAVQGFAVTLTIGIIASMITAVFVTRTFYLIWLRRRPDMQTVSI